MSKRVKIAGMNLFLASFLFLACEKEVNDSSPAARDFRQDMREFVGALSDYGRARKADFIIIPQNGQELVTLNGEADGESAAAYINAIDGVGREDLFYGYYRDNQATPAEDLSYMLKFLDLCEQNGVQVLTTDYCSSHDKMDDSFQKNAARGYISFAAPRRGLDIIPDYPKTPFNVNDQNVTALAEARNFLYLINPEKFASKSAFISALAQTDYDVIIMDCFFNEQILSAAEIASLKIKKNGGVRLVISYLSIGEAEEYRYYWNSAWKKNPPAWLEEENPDWPGNFKVRYWDESWQKIIYGGPDTYLDKIINAQFDGVYLDIIDAFEYFENK